METKKKKLSKKAVIIGSVVLAVVLVVGGVFIYKYATREKLYTFDEITQGLSEQVSYVVDADGEWKQEVIDKTYDKYKDFYYLRNIVDEQRVMNAVSGANYAKYSLICYDKDNDFLFKITERTYTIDIYVNGSDYEYVTAKK